MELRKYQYLIVSLDPVHVGTGGYRLGRVDNAIVREPGTNLPKIPGTSLHGSFRSAAARYFGDPRLAGQRPHGDVNSNPVVYTFGAGEEGGFSSGVVNISDAQILLFPISSQSGPVWITTNENLENAGFNLSANSDKPSSIERVLIGSGLSGVGNKFPLGWIMFDVEESGIDVAPPDNWKNENLLTKTLKRTVIIHSDIFSELVESNLEIRTSVAINPETGAAEHRALFTYEAIPRATFLIFNVVVDDYRTESFPSQNESLGWNGPKDVVETGCRLLEYLGVGGMGTRGFGRIKVVGDPKEEVFSNEQSNPNGGKYAGQSG